MLNKKFKNIIILIVILINSCSYPEIVRDELVYFNDFEENNLINIHGGAISKFDESYVLGNFNSESFSLHIENVGDHDYVFVSFDLYIHGTWDGNFNGFENNDKPDKWGIEFNPDMTLFKDRSTDLFITTFSNSPCFSNYCLRQSYPNTYPYENPPKTGHYETNLTKVCHNSFFGGETTLYKFEKGFRSSGNALVIRFFDELYQPNAIDQDGNIQSKCNESWSIDNLSVRVVSYK